MMTITQAARKWGVSRPTIHAWIEAKLIRAERVGKVGPYVVHSDVPPAAFDTGRPRGKVNGK